MKTQQYIDEYLVDLGRLMGALDQVNLDQAVEWLRVARDEGRMIYFCGNGGSGAIASEAVADLVKGASQTGHGRFRALALTDSKETLMAYANDEGYETVFEEPLKNFAVKGDILVAISGSGESENVLRAVAFARSIGCKTIGLTTSDGGALKDKVDLALLVPSEHMGRLEDCFYIITHILCYAFMELDI